MMRKKNIGGKVLNLLEENFLTDAVELFNQECDVREQCNYSDNTKNCVNLCLIPKLNFLEIRDGNYEVSLIIENLKKK